MFILVIFGLIFVVIMADPVVSITTSKHLFYNGINLLMSTTYVDRESVANDGMQSGQSILASHLVIPLQPRAGISDVLASSMSLVQNLDKPLPRSASTIDFSSDENNCGKLGNLCRAEEVCIWGRCITRLSGPIPGSCGYPGVDCHNNDFYCDRIACWPRLPYTEGRRQIDKELLCNRIVGRLPIPLVGPEVEDVCNLIMNQVPVTGPRAPPQGGEPFVCGRGTTRCGNLCTIAASDINNCGRCGIRCGGPGAFCNNGRCDCTPAGHTSCNNLCINTASDSNNCGGCGNTDPTRVCRTDLGFTCQNGSCQCPSGLSNCSGICTNKSTDELNCGVCRRICDPPTNFCLNGVCSECTGASGKQICYDENSNNNECISLKDNDHCGNCQTECAPDQVCESFLNNLPTGGVSISYVCVIPQSPPPPPCPAGTYQDPRGQCVPKCRDQASPCSVIGQGPWRCGPNGFFPDREVCCRPGGPAGERSTCI